MDPELKRLLEETHALARDNHHLLRAVRRHQIFETFGKWILWLILIVLSAYGYLYFLQPLVQKFGVPGQNGQSSSQFQKLLNSFGSGGK